MKLTNEQAEAIVRLQQSSDFAHLVDALNAYRHEAVEFTLFGPDANSQVSRGMARAATEILRAISGARAQLERGRH